MQVKPLFVSLRNFAPKKQPWPILSALPDPLVIRNSPEMPHSACQQTEFSPKTCTILATSDNLPCWNSP